MVGEVYGRLTVLEDVRIPGNRKMHHLCRCTCGTTKTIRADSLKSGAVVSCGCYHSEITSTHRLSKSKLYKCWDSMKQRCYNPDNISYKDYGDRGISICESWLDDFMSFYNWAIDNGYQDYLTIDRIDNDGNYEPGNCRWATRADQSRNRRNTLSIDDVKRIIADPRSNFTIAHEYDITLSQIWRIKTGRRWSGVIPDGDNG